MKQTITSADLFSLPFRFSVGSQNDKEKRTLLGGLISILIIGVSLAYFIYLCYLYNTNSMQPNIAQMEVYSKESFSNHINSDFATVQVTMKNGQSLFEYQASKQKVYTMVIAQFYTKESTGEYKNQMLRGISCTDSQKKGQICFNLTENNLDGLTLNYENGKPPIPYLIMLAQCIPDLLLPGEVCEFDPTVILDELLILDTQIQLIVNLQQYNTKTKQFEYKTQIETFMFDQTLAFYTQLHLIKSDVSITDGFVIQSPVTSTIFSNYKRVDQSFTMDSLLKSTSLYLFGVISLQMTQNNTQISIQFPPFTQLLAMFSSVFNSLLTVGVICKILAESEIGQDLIQVHLKVYYKKTAAKLIEKNPNFKEQLCRNEREGQQLSNIQLNEKIQEIDFTKEAKKVFKIGFVKRLLYFLSPPNSTNPNEVRIENDPLEVKMYKSLQEKSSRSIDIFSIQKQLLELRMMMKLMLTPEQFSAMQLCGSSVQVNQKTGKRKPGNSQSLSQSRQSKIHAVNFADDLHALQQVKPGPSSKKLLPFNRQADMQVTPINDVRNDLKNEEYPKVGSKEEYIEDDVEVIEFDGQLNHLEIMDSIEEDYSVLQENFTKFLKTNENLRTDLDRRIQNCLILPESSTQITSLQKKL